MYKCRGMWSCRDVASCSDKACVVILSKSETLGSKSKESRASRSDRKKGTTIWLEAWTSRNQS